VKSNSTRCAVGWCEQGCLMNIYALQKSSLEGLPNTTSQRIDNQDFNSLHRYLELGKYAKFDLQIFTVIRLPNATTIQYDTIQLNVLVPSLQKYGRLCITMSVNMCDNSYEEKAQLNRCDLSARLKAG